MNTYFFTVIFPFKKSVCLLALVTVVYLIASSFKSKSTSTNFHNIQDSVISKTAFLKVYDVLMHPRCMNCHPSGDVPLVGEDSRLHKPVVKRGIEGKGTYSKCANCHQDENTVGLNLPPGSPNWRMPPAGIKMIFQGKTPGQLAAQLLDTTSNGNKTKADLIKHVSEDGLVLYGWNPGEGRKTPPLSHADFVKQFELWINNGAYLPED